MPEIPLTKGKVAIVDAIDFEYLSRWKWHFLNSGYAKRTAHNAGEPYDILMHRFLMCPPPGWEVDHINRNRLDNRRGNLRVCKRTQNNYNATKRRGTTSRFKGVSWCNTYEKWLARIRADGKIHHIGYFADEAEAARAWNAKALELHGEYATQNAI